MSDKPAFEFQATKAPTEIPKYNEAQLDSFSEVIVDMGKNQVGEMQTATVGEITRRMAHQQLTIDNPETSREVKIYTQQDLKNYNRILNGVKTQLPTELRQALINRHIDKITEERQQAEEARQRAIPTG